MSASRETDLRPDPSKDSTEVENTKIVDVTTPVNAKSQVWTYFGHPVYENKGVRSTDKKKTVCKLCKACFSHTGNTTNMYTHIKRHHPSYRAKLDGKPGNSASGLAQGQALGTSSHDVVSSDENVTRSTRGNQPKLAEFCEKKYAMTSTKALSITKQLGIYIA